MTEKALEIVKINDPSLYGLESDILAVGDALVEVSGRPAHDQLDYHYYTSREQVVRLKVHRKNGSVRDIQIDADLLQKLDIAFSPMDFRRCRCKCPFCFVDQMPKGMRRSLYFKDEDTRLSFLYGNFTTMNDITETEIDKIIEQQLSPQYVSVHAVDRELREWVFGRPMKRDILATLKKLAQGGITLHTQVVLCPGKNDGAHLDETIQALEALDSNVGSLAVVPVGLTRHRERLPDIEPYDKHGMETVIDQVEAYQERFLHGERKSRFVFLSDEWYIESGRSLPEYSTYEDLPQLDNGVGMTRHFLNEIEEDIKDVGMPERLDECQIVTGTLGSVVFHTYILPVLAEHSDGLPHIIAVTNRFFGETVTVSGLLTLGDIREALLQADSERKRIILPPNMLNYEGKFLDGPTLEELKRETSLRFIVPEGSLVHAFHDSIAREG